MSKLLPLTCLALLALALTACCPKMRAYKVTLIADDTVRDKTISVHIVGVNPKDKPRWEEYSMSKYWAPGDPLHASAPVYTRILFDPSAPTTQSLDRSDPIWETWLSYGATDLFILVNLTTMIDDTTGNKDPRRQIIAIDNCAYLKDLPDREVRLIVTKSGVRVETPLKPD